MAATLSFDASTRVATSDELAITCQEILDQFRAYEDDVANMDLPQMIAASGKEPLEGGDITIITVTLLDGWRIGFPAQGGPDYVNALVTGGNLIGRVGDIESALQNPFAPAAYVSPSRAAATAGATIDPNDVGSAAEVADAVWDEDMADLQTAGSTGQELRQTRNAAMSGQG